MLILNWKLRKTSCVLTTRERNWRTIKGCKRSKIWLQHWENISQTSKNLRKLKNNKRETKIYLNFNFHSRTVVISHLSTHHQKGSRKRWTKLSQWTCTKTSPCSSTCKPLNMLIDSLKTTNEQIPSTMHIQEFAQTSNWWSRTVTKRSRNSKTWWRQWSMRMTSGET